MSRKQAFPQLHGHASNILGTELDEIAGFRADPYVDTLLALGRRVDGAVEKVRAAAVRAGGGGALSASSVETTNR